MVIKVWKPRLRAWKGLSSPQLPTSKQAWNLPPSTRQKRKGRLPKLKQESWCCRWPEGAAGKLCNPPPRPRPGGPGKLGVGGPKGGVSGSWIQYSLARLCHWVLSSVYQLATHPSPLPRGPLSPCDGSNLPNAPWSLDLTTYLCLYPPNCAVSLQNKLWKCQWMPWMN